MALPNLIVSAVAEWNGKALTKGTSQISKFDKTVKNLGRTLGITFSAAALLGYSKKAVAAYGEQIAEAKRLEQALRNIGFQYATAEAEGYIDALEKMTGVNRDVLQPAFIELTQVTGSTTFAQNMLTTAMDVSAATGMELTQATKILSQAYVGNYKGLKQLNLGLTNAELSAKSYLEIEKLIAAQYAGQSKLAADSYQGALSRLKISAEQASEQIGQALVSALGTSAGGMDKLIDKVDGAADSISGLITNTAYLTKELGNLFSSIPGAGVLDNAFRGLKNYLGRFSIGALRNNVDKVLGRQGGFPQGVPQDLRNLQTNTEKAKADKEALKRQKELIALQKKAQLAEKNKLSLSKAAAVFDSNRISIAAALQATYDKETRLRLEALMAIEDEQGDLALKKINELAALQKNADLAKLAGITTIGDAALRELNNRLLTELKVINDSKMAEDQKELAREEAFKKYNAALVAAGGLAEKNSYDERVQIQLTEIAKLAALSNTLNAGLTLNKIRESEEITTIDKIAKAQKAADDARMKALLDYIEMLKKLGGGGPTGPTGPLGPLKPPVIPPKIDLLKDIRKDFIEPIKTTGGSIGAILEYADAATERANAFATLLDDQNKADELALNDYLKKLGMSPNPTVDTFGSIPTPSPGDIQSGNRYAAQARNYYVTVNAGVISQPDEFTTLVQNTIQDLNRGGDPLTTAGAL